MKHFYCTIIAFVVLISNIKAQADLKTKINQMALLIESKAIHWRQHLHQHPELSNREFKTSAYVEKHLRDLGLEVRTKVAHTGVVAILKGDHPGPVVALRADMDGLPVKERTHLPFASTAKGEYLGEEVDVMHACGHDAHTAILMGAAEILSSMKSSLTGTVMFIFQPAEEQAPPGEEGGAQLMIKEGVLRDPAPEVIFGLHIRSDIPTGVLKYRYGSTMAAVNTMFIKVKGKSAHGSTPWNSIDPIVTSAQIIMGLQTIVSRQMDLTKEPVVITIGKIEGGVRSNIIPEEVTMHGTIRSLDTSMQRIMLEKIKHTIHSIAESAGATAEVTIDNGYPATVNDIDLTRKMLPTLFAVAGEENVQVRQPMTGAEDFSFFAQKIPGLYYFLGGMPPSQDPATAPGHHTPDFFVEDASLLLGMRSMCHLVVDYLAKK